MPELPSGQVTFLFTDIEGSTRLWEADPAAMRAAVSRHDLIMAEQIDRHGGYLFKHVGDAVQAAFADPTAAVSAVGDLQRAFAAAAWPETGPLLVRMALHRGEAAPNAASDYNQVACLNRLSRLLAAGYGGQVLLSAAVHRLVAGSLPPGVRLKDLGRHRLRDLLEPERVAQLVIDRLPDHFPPLKSLERYPTNLPRQPNPLIGRTDELATVSDLLLDPDIQLVTVTGPGGVGKTRLATQAGADVLDHFEDGVWFVGLGPLEDPALVLPAIAGVLGVREGSGQSLAVRLEEFLASRTTLLVLDNFEHLVDAAPDLDRLIDTCPNLTVLATSRGPLELRTERLFPLGPLATPARSRSQQPVALADIAATEAVALFVQRAQAKSPAFALRQDAAAAVAAICRRLDGLPLAIELAAARTIGLPPAELLQELDHRFKLLTGGARDLLPHQQALETTIAWSYDRLSPADQAVFRRLTIFAGDFTREAADVVVSAAGPTASYLPGSLLTLVANSLLRRVDDSSPTRYTLLESLRAFGRTRLDQAAEAAPTQRAHATIYLDLTHQAAPQLNGPDQAAWRERLAADHDNLRAALDWAVSERELDTALGLVGTLWRFWHARGFLVEGQRRVEDVISLGHESSALLGATPFTAAGTLARARGDHAAASRWFDLGIAAARETGDRTAEAMLLNNLGGLHLSLGQHHRAVELFESCLVVCRELEDRWREAHVLSNLASVDHYLGNVERAEVGYRAALEIWEAGTDRRRIALTLGNLILLLAPIPSRYDEARAIGEHALAESRALAFPAGMVAALTGLGAATLGQGNLELAARYHAECVEVCRESENRTGLATALGNLALVVTEQGDVGRGVSLATESLSEFTELGDNSGVAFTLELLALIASAGGALETAVHFHAAADALSSQIEQPLQHVLRDRHETSVAQLRQQFGSAFARHWQAGRDLDRTALRNELSALTLAPALAPKLGAKY